MIGSKFMGRAHSNAWADGRPLLRRRSAAGRCTSSCARNADELAEFAARWGWAHSTTDWREAATSDDDRPRRHRDAEQRPRRAGDRRARGRQARRLREAAGRHARRRRGDGGGRRRRRRVGRSCGSTTAACRPSPSRTSSSPTGALGRIYHVRAAYLQSWGGPGHAAAVALPGRRRRLRRPRRPQRPHHRHGALRHRRGDRHDRRGDRAHVHHRAHRHRRRRRRRDRRRRRGDERSDGAEHGRRRRAVPRPHERRRPGQLRGVASGDRLPQRQPLRDPRRARRAALRLRADERARLYDATGDGRVAGLDDDRRHPRRRRPSLRRGVVARQPRPRLRAQLRQPGGRHPRRARRRRRRSCRCPTSPTP